MAEKEEAQPKRQKRTLTGLAARLGRLPADKKRAALEMSAALAGVSLRVSRDFVESIPKAAKILSAEDLRHWGELGRRLAMGNAETGSIFFKNGVSQFGIVPKNARHFVFQVATRQLVLSSSTALKTFESIPTLAADINDDDLLKDVLQLADTIANRSAKHSSEFLQHSTAVANGLEGFGKDKRKVAAAVVELGHLFATRTGGMAADLWANLPNVFAGQTASNIIRLMAKSGKILDFGGSVTLFFVSAGGEVLKHNDAVFDDWCDVLSEIGAHGNTPLIAFLKATPLFFRQVAVVRQKTANKNGHDIVRRVLKLTGQIASIDAESALAAFRSSTRALTKVSLEQFEEWIETGLREKQDETAKARRSYFALETRQSRELLQETVTGLSLESIRTILRIYVEGLTGKEIEVAPISSMPQESRIGDGKTIYLPQTVSAFEDDEKDFRLYKVLAAFGAGQIEFGTFEKDSTALKAAYTELSLYFAEQSEDISLSGNVKKEAGSKTTLPKDSDYRKVLLTFPDPRLARKIFGTMENARIDNLLRYTYRGLRKDLDLMRNLSAAERPFIFDVPMHQVPFELLFQITLCGGASEDARRFYGQIVSEIETVLENNLLTVGGRHVPSVADSLVATSRVYSLFQNIFAEETPREPEPNQEKSEFAYDDKNAGEAVTEDQVKREKSPKKPQDLKDLFNAWNSLEEDGEPDDVSGAEAWSQHDMPEQALEPGDEAFAYDEWDRELNDYRVGWSRVIEKKVKLGERTFVELTRSRYSGVISSIRHQFQLLKPENLTRVHREIDGEDYDLEALIDHVVDKRAAGQPSERIYTKKLRRERDVAVSLLLDQSSSTARTITKNPSQPYTYPGQRIIEIEKEGLVLMSEALEAVGDIYSIYGFTSEGRRNVKFYVVKDFNERYSPLIEQRIGGITFQNNTRLGASIRHAAAKLLRQESRTKLLIILTDGRPYDHDYGDVRYAREDVREALTEARMSGITPFCITIDRESESELRDLYGEVGYTIIDDVLSLPERIPNIYRRLTS